MYDGCFGLSRRPFAAVPQIDHYFPATAIEGARTVLTRCIQRGEGTGLVIGPAGTGKTLLCRMLGEQFRRSFQVVMLPNGRLSSRRDLFQAILFELGRPYRGMDEGETRLALVEYLMSDESSPRGLVLLVDEAHTLPLRLLDEIRLLTNLVRNGQPLVRVVLAGGPLLEERFASPKLESFSQRLSARCYLEAFNRTETESFIQAQVTAAGGLGEQVFPKETCQSVFQATGGVPRLIGQVCDHALLLAYVAGRPSIEPANIDEAWGDLQQLPTPWTGEAKQQEPSGEGVIEFGSLDEAESAPPAAATVSMPALRISPMEEEGREEEAEPGEQICRIEQLLAEADDFEPAGAITPEIELHLSETEYPFGEEFEHEEVVADRYAAAAPPMVPVVEAPSARRVAAPLPQPEAPTLPWESVEEKMELIEQSIVGEGGAAESDREIVSSPPYVLPTERDWEPVAALATSSAPDWLMADQEHMQQVQVAVPPTQTPEKKPPREFRQLFSRLRRG